MTGRDMTTYSETPRFDAAFDLHRIMRRRMGVPPPLADRIVRRVNRFWNASRAELRRRNMPGVEGLHIPDEDGYLLLPPGMLPGSEAALAVCRDLFAQTRATWSGPDPKSTKDFLISLVRDGGFARHPEILRFLISPTVLASVSRYLGGVPRLSTVRLWWTPPNDSMERSQVWHIDPEDTRQLKLFLNVFEIDAEQGPFTFCPASASRPLLKKAGIRQRHFEDAAVAAAGEPIVLTGPAGSGAFIDTSRCVHFGSRGNRRDRVVLMAQYTDFYAPGVRAASWAKAVNEAGLSLSPPEKLALCVE